MTFLSGIIGGVRLSIAVVIATLSVAVTAGWTGQWPEFRGPTGQGISSATGLPVSWSAEENVVWKRELPGNGWSSPVVAAERIYLTSAVAKGGKPTPSLRVLCVDLESGSLLWDVEAIDPNPAKAIRFHRKNSHASPTPIVEAGRVYAHFGHYGAACLDTDGEVVWRNTEWDYNPVHGNGGSPVIVGDRLIFNADGGESPWVGALNKETGETVWRVDRRSDARQSFSFSTPLAIEVDGQKQVVSPGSDLVAAYDPASGEEIWRVRYDGYSVVPRPVYHQGLIFISTGFNQPEVLAIRPDGRGDVTETHVAWRLSRGAPKTPSMLGVGEELYVLSDNGIVTCVDARTGETHWQERVEGNYSASPVFADGLIYLQNEQGTGTVLKAGRAFERVARNPLDERTLASYAVADRSLLIRGEEHLYRIREE